MSENHAQPPAEPGLFFQRAIEAWNAREFQQIPAFLEPLWLKAGNERRFFLGLMRAAEALEAAQEKKTPRAITLLGQALDKLKGYPDHCHELDLDALRADLQTFRLHLEQKPNLDKPTSEWPRLQREIRDSRS